MLRAPGHSTAPAASTKSPESRSELGIAWVSALRPGPWFPLAGERLVLGRGEDCASVVGGREASRHHAEIRGDGPVWVINDLGSTNGTFVNGERQVQAPLGPGTVLRIGGTVGVVVARSSAAGAPGLATIAPGFFGGAALRRAVEPASRVAADDLPLIIEGETGCGKERVARFVHDQSGRKGAFVAVNCAALPENLAEAELFGYRKGAFTGAERPNPGHLRAAHGGTLLLDEILDLPLSLQAKLLRAVEQREVVPLGESSPVAIDVRVMAASQAPLEEAVRAGRFRGDLYARLDGLTLRLPPLRERGEEAALLFERFVLERSGGHPPALEPKLVEALCLYDWPFNVREVELLARRLLSLHGHEPMLMRAHLPDRVLKRTREPPQAAAGAAPDELSRLVAALRAHGGVVQRAAAAAGVSRQRAYRLMAENDLELDAFRGGAGSG